MFQIIDAHPDSLSQTGQGEIMNARWVQVLTGLAVVALLAGCTVSPEMVPEANKELVRQFVDASNAHDYEQIKSLLTPTFTRHCQATPEVTVSNPDEMIAFLKSSEASCPDEHVDVKHIVADDSLVAVWAVYSGTQDGQMGPFPPSHKRMTIDFAGFFRVDNGKLAELWVTWDNLAGLMQLGYFPPPMPDSAS